MSRSLIRGCISNVPSIPKLPMIIYRIRYLCIPPPPIKMILHVSNIPSHPIFFSRALENIGVTGDEASYIYM